MGQLRKAYNMAGENGNDNRMIPKCSAGIDTRRRVQNLEVQMEHGTERNEKEHDSIWNSITGVRNRPPIWCTALIALLTALMSAAIAIAAMK